jgi:drug/metabolite transporter superfamily protein YnfA
MGTARASLAGALVMLLGIWVMANDQSAWDTKDVVFAVIALLGVAVLLVGIDIRRPGGGTKEE